MKRRLLLLSATTALVLVVVGYPALRLGGAQALAYAAVAAALCLVPSAGSLLWSSWALDAAPEQQLIAVLGGTGLRMAVVLAGGLGLYAWFGYFRDTSFWVWLLAFYLVTLATEMTLLLAGRVKTAHQGESALKSC